MGRISKLHEYALNKINGKFSHLHVLENYYPDWLLSPIGTRLELDVFIEEMNIAAEIQGDQHSKFIPFFHGTIEKFNKQKEYDNHKQYICRERGIKLYDLSTEKDVDIMIFEIQEIIESLDKNKPKFFYQIDEDKRKSARNGLRDKFSGLKQALRKSNGDKDAEKRLAKTIESIKKYKRGDIFADEEKLSAWNEVIKNKGFLDVDSEYKRSIEKEIILRNNYEKTVD